MQDAELDEADAGTPRSRIPPTTTALGGHLQGLAASHTAPSLRCGASCTFMLSLQRHGRKKVGSLRSAIGLLAADVETLGGQGGGPWRGARRPSA